MSSPPSGRSGEPGLRAVVDTNVWVSGLLIPKSPPGRILRAIREGRLEPVASWELGREIAQVLARPKFRRYGVTEDDTREILLLLAPFLPSVEMDIPIRDPKDAPVVAAAVAAGADAIVTGDRDLLGDPSLRDWLGDRGVEVLTPAEALRHLASQA